jgi:hypothetical protein
LGFKDGGDVLENLALIGSPVNYHDQCYKQANQQRRTQHRPIVLKTEALDAKNATEQEQTWQ